MVWIKLYEHKISVKLNTYFYYERLTICIIRFPQFLCIKKAAISSGLNIAACLNDRNFIFENFH